MRDIAAAAPNPLRPGPADHVQGRQVPGRGWKWWTCGNGGMLNFHWAAGSHFPNRPGENARTPRKLPFSDLHGHLHGNAVQADRWTSLTKWRRSTQAPAVISHP